jgi:hypothetical protein
VVAASVAGAPDAALLAAVEQNLHARELMAFDVQVKPPNILPVDIAVEYTGGTDETEIRIIAEQYVYTVGIGGRFEIRKLYDLYKPLYLKTLEIVSPVRDIQADTLYVVVGTITVTRASS